MKKLVIFLILATFLTPLSLNAASYKVSSLGEVDSTRCLYTAGIIIDTEGKDSNSADLIVEFNESEISILDADKTRSGVQVVPGNAYESYVYNNVEGSEIKVTAVRFDSLNGSRTFIEVPFVAKSAEVNFKIKFLGIGNTYDSNIAELTTSNDILTKVEEAKLTPANYNCNLNEQQINAIELPQTEEAQKSDNSVLVGLFFSFGTCLSLLLVYVLLFLFKFKRIKVLNQKGMTIEGALVNIFNNKTLVESYVSNKNGVIYLKRSSLKKYIKISHKEYKEELLENGISGSTIVLNALS
jgi:hypothetical protein